MKIAFTGSFDPPHKGHKFVVDTCKDLGFDVVVFIASNPNKQYFYSLEERLSKSEELFNCQVLISTSEFVAEDIISNGISFVARGLRDTKDYIYEEEITDFNYLNFGIKTIYIPSYECIKKISSSAIKEK